MPAPGLAGRRATIALIAARFSLRHPQACQLSLVTPCAEAS